MSKHSVESYECDLCGQPVESYDLGLVTGEPERQLCKLCIELAAKVLRFCHVPHSYQDTSLPKRLTVDNSQEKLTQAQQAADRFKRLIEERDKFIEQLQQQLRITPGREADRLNKSVQVHQDTDWTKTDALTAMMWLENLEFQVTLGHKATSVIVDELNRLTQGARTP
jgi:hypothetical protein